jgi:hypothetical protein
VIHTVNVDSFEIEKIKFDLKLHALTSKVGRYIAKVLVVLGLALSSDD